MMTDLHHLLAIYVHAHQTGNSVPPHIDAEARAVLADEPAVPEGREPAAVAGQPNWRGLCEELVDAWLKGDDIVSAMNRARAVLARWGTSNLTQTRLLPTDGEVAELVEWLQEEADDYECIGCEDSAAKCKRAAELLQRQALVPVSVSERLPGPEDCDSHGWCWVLYSAHSTWTLEPPYGQDGMPTGWTHWLPAHALPLPEVGE